MVDASFNKAVIISSGDFDDVVTQPSSVTRPAHIADHGHPLAHVYPKPVSELCTFIPKYPKRTSKRSAEEPDIKVPSAKDDRGLAVPGKGGMHPQSTRPSSVNKTCECNRSRVHTVKHYTKTTKAIYSDVGYRVVC